MKQHAKNKTMIVRIKYFFDYIQKDKKLGDFPYFLEWYEVFNNKVIDTHFMKFESVLEARMFFEQNDFYWKKSN
ncbi:MAG: hypothetical protein ACXADW_12775 [Candidatus Hodarchaeales archaeon]